MAAVGGAEGAAGVDLEALARGAGAAGGGAALRAGAAGLPGREAAALLLPLAAEALAGGGRPRAARALFGALGDACGRAQRRPAAVLGSTLELALHAVEWASAEERALGARAGEGSPPGSPLGGGRRPPELPGAALGRWTSRLSCVTCEPGLTGPAVIEPPPPAPPAPEEAEAREELEALQEALVQFAAGGAALLARCGAEVGAEAERGRLRRLCFRALYRFTGRSPLACKGHARTEWALALVGALRALGVTGAAGLLPAAAAERGGGGEGGGTQEDGDAAWEERVGAALALHASLMHAEEARLPLPEGPGSRLDLACAHAQALFVPPPPRGDAGGGPAPWHEWYGALNTRKGVEIARRGAELAGGRRARVEGSCRPDHRELCETLAAVAVQHPSKEVRSNAVRALRAFLASLGATACLEVLARLCDLCNVPPLLGLLVTYTKDRLAEAWREGSFAAGANAFLTPAAVELVLSPIPAEAETRISGERLEDEIEAVIPALNALRFLLLRARRASPEDRAMMEPLVAGAVAAAPHLRAPAEAAMAARPSPDRTLALRALLDVLYRLEEDKAGVSQGCTCGSQKK